MNARFTRLTLVLLFAATLVACASNNPAQPSPGDGSSGVGSTASVTVPVPSQPIDGAQVRNIDQPVTLVVRNAVVTKSGATTYTFEVATDSAFATKVQTKDGVAEGSGDQTGAKLDALAPAKDYYWHARATAGGTTGTFGTTYKFTVGPAIAIDPPEPIGPLTGATTALRPALRVANATRQGPVGAITYRFEIAPTSTFGSIVATATVAEGINETGFIPTTDLPNDVTFFWRAYAIDAASGVSSAPSAVHSFTTRQVSQAEIVAAKLGVTLWPGIQPPGQIGHAFMDDSWQIRNLYYVPGRVTFQSPDREMLRCFDLFDRGFNPAAVSDWMNANGYPTRALWYPGPEKAVLGLQYVYLAAMNKVIVNTTWTIVLRVE
jgi:hypothetical protein